MLSYKSLYGIAKFNQLKDYYAILKISKTNDQPTIKKAYYALAKKFHPDVNQGKEDKFKEVNEAYEILSDENTKKEYDAARTPQSQNSQTYQQQQYYDSKKYQSTSQQRQNQNYTQNQYTRNQFEENIRRAQEYLNQQQQSGIIKCKMLSQQQYRQYERMRAQQEYEDRIRQEEMYARAKDQQYNEFSQRYYNENKRKTFYSQEEKEAYDSFVRQREFEESIKEKIQEFKQKGYQVREGFQNISKNLADIKGNLGSIWNTIKGKNR
ncbi:unnamed protein product (macronuclear) [Paramecium tetraurelia]|uniref:J domain-containing protein n=1 Tax=Paramecium tetraurelia TaxID=5888 RepID=A0CNA5_PARTE|nr:uncharacterized protein GSPATT00008713001 [Paramecium tetraurelia]CAK72272.1 unnamed protein product [Paramecium tetraurelia]|eukprot:XP_001439669.1 hypothetical protein (macronuclear) [Paramecium tetraurelia strain d4-2]